MHTIVLTIPHLNPAMLLPTSQSVLLYPTLVHIKYEVNVPRDESVFMYLNIIYDNPMRGKPDSGWWMVIG
jgi:hypothetical protein